ncbi:hypothetical protein GCM10020369_44340 [Cryptosporangium minutisporangium]|uniref:Aspartate carbamoyltransferase n=2 Tax=Cryptosporangium minutisporangium TaxID=113569 RepID=A0ABP6T367_9ACTN
MNPRDSPATRWLLLLSTAVGVGLLAGGCTSDSTKPEPSASTRQGEIAERGASVMPFDLDRTTHRFVKTGSGGVQTVVSDDPQDATRVRLVRQHLQEETARFRRGDFDDPGRIHGTEMPGLQALREHGGRIVLAYAPTADGGRITYTTSDPELREALHAWFDAQVSDHGQHATR